MAAEKDRRSRQQAPKDQMPETPVLSETAVIAEGLATLPIEEPTQGTDANELAVRTSFKVQINLSALNYWRLNVQAANENKECCVLVQEWIAPQLDKGTYPPRPNWVKSAIEAVAARARKKGAA